MKFFVQGKDIVAAILIVGCFTLKAMGRDGTLDTVIIGIAIAYGLVNFIPTPKSRG